MQPLRLRPRLRYCNYEQVRYNPPKNAPADGTYLFGLYKRNHAITRTNSAGKRVEKKQFGSCLTGGFKRKKNYVITVSGASVTPHTVVNRLIGWNFPRSVSSTQVASIGFQVGKDPASINASVPIYAKDRATGYVSSWEKEYNLPAQKEYENNLVTAYWAGRSDQFEGNPSTGLWEYNQKTADPEDPSGDSGTRGFAAAVAVKWKCGSIFGVGC